MEKPMTPSDQKVMTDRQINKAVSNYRALLEKHKSDFQADAVQRVLGQSALADEQFEIFRRLAELQSGLIIRHVKVDRSRSPQGALAATGRAQYVDQAVVATMPRGEGDEREVAFFKPEPWEYPWEYENGVMSDEALERAFKRRDLGLADPYSLAAANEADQTFADTHPNGTHWKDADGDWCFVAFDRWPGERGVRVNRRAGGWLDRWWFAGLRKTSA